MHFFQQLCWKHSFVSWPPKVTVLLCPLGNHVPLPLWLRDTTLYSIANQIPPLPFIGNHASTHSVSNQAPQALLITMYFHTHRESGIPLPHRESCLHAHQVPCIPVQTYTQVMLSAVCSLTHEKSEDCRCRLPACGSKAASEALSSRHCCSSLGSAVAEPLGGMRRCHAFLWSVIIGRWAATQLWEACPTGHGSPPQTSVSLPGFYH